MSCKYDPLQAVIWLCWQFQLLLCASQQWEKWECVPSSCSLATTNHQYEIHSHWSRFCTILLFNHQTMLCSKWIHSHTLSWWSIQHNRYATLYL